MELYAQIITLVAIHVRVRVVIRELIVNMVFLYKKVTDFLRKVMDGDWQIMGSVVAMWTLGSARYCSRVTVRAYTCSRSAGDLAFMTMSISDKRMCCVLWEKRTFGSSPCCNKMTSSCRMKAKACHGSNRKIQTLFQTATLLLTVAFTYLFLFLFSVECDIFRSGKYKNM